MPGRCTKVPTENKIETPCSICGGLIYLRKHSLCAGTSGVTEASEELLEMQQKRRLRQVEDVWMVSRGRDSEVG